MSKQTKRETATRHNKEQDRCRRKAGKRTEIVFILDASGSMSGLEDDTVGGFNAMIEENRLTPGEAKVSTIIFNDRSRVMLDRVDIEEVPRLTRRTYRCSGCTALLDAVGGAIEHTALVQRVQPRGYEADKVLFVITTDGMENASRRYGYAQVKHLIERQRELVGEGTRLFDIKRWHIDLRRGTPQNESLCLLPGPNTTEMSVAADSPRLTWPIPKHEMDVNRAIVQNPGY